MSAGHPTASDLGRDPGAVARALAEWHRGDVADAVLATLRASSRDLHSRAYTAWLWSGVTAQGAPAWALPVESRWTESFRPKGPALALVRLLAAAVDAQAVPEAISLHDWHGFTCVVLPGIEPDLVADALHLHHLGPLRAAIADLPDEVALGGPRLALPPLGPRDGDGLIGLARATRVHPIRVALALLEHGQPPDQEGYHPELVPLLREWGCDGPRPEPEAPRFAIDDDPCPRRRHARRVLQRLLRMGKVGPQYHTEFDHLARGVAADDRREALETGEMLLRAGLLGEKPSVGQRHVYLRREALPQIHALIDRGATSDPGLAAHWSATAPGD